MIVKTLLMVRLQLYYNYEDDVQRVLINAKFLCPSSPVSPDNKEGGKIKILAQLHIIILVSDIGSPVKAPEATEQRLFAMFL